MRTVREWGNSYIRSQHGQSAVEFIIFLIILAPLYFSIQYVGKYIDLMQSTVSASRYAISQRTMQPDTTLLSNQKIEDQMRRRFFQIPADGMTARIRTDDSVIGEEKSDTPILWLDFSSKPLLASTNNVTLKFRSQDLPSSVAGASAKIMASAAGLPYDGAVIADVNVTLENRLDLASAKPEPIVVTATTASLANVSGSSGSSATRVAAAVSVPSSYIPEAISIIVEKVMLLFEPSGPILGCIKPDVVPSDRLEGYSYGGSCR